MTGKFSEYVALSNELGGTPAARVKAYAAIFEGDDAAAGKGIASESDHERIVAFLTHAGRTPESADARASAAVSSPLLDSSAQLVANSREWANRPERGGRHVPE